MVRPFWRDTQGEIVGPLVANLQMHRVLKYWRRTGNGEARDAHIVNYADDFVILRRERTG